jgi:hypothetical protein
LRRVGHAPEEARVDMPRPLPVLVSFRVTAGRGDAENALVGEEQPVYFLEEVAGGGAGEAAGFAVVVAGPL